MVSAVGRKRGEDPPKIVKGGSSIQSGPLVSGGPEP
jgi:hypothetical protein